MKSLILSGKKISKTFEQGKSLVPVLESIDVDIYDGDFTVIMGPSGAGKSTLLYALSGMDTLSGGRLFYKDKEISAFSEKQMATLRAKDFGFIFQKTHLVSNLSLFENVAIAGYLDKTRTEQQVNENALKLLKEMGVDEDALYRPPHQTSGGEAQRASIARAVINKPGLLFADEPTGALNRRNSEAVLDLLIKLHNSSQNILMVTHDLRAALRGNRILYLEDGRIFDELNLPVFQLDNEKEREERVSRWLSKLSW